MKRKEYYHDRPDSKLPIKLRRFCVQKRWEQFVFPSINFTFKVNGSIRKAGETVLSPGVNTEIRKKKFSCLVDT